ncbi:MAG: response regulator [Gemmatimonadaceae bacterium]|nr:response regulator [Gemmatimonadaceae bacterium]
MNPRSHPPTADKVVASLAAWRRRLLFTVVSLGVAVVLAFTFERMASADTEHSSAVLREASHAQRMLLSANFLAQILQAGIPAHQASDPAALVDTVHAAVATLRAMTADNPRAQLRLDSLQRAMQRWDTLFIGRVRDGEPPTSSRSLRGLLEFDRLSRQLDTFIAEEYRLEAERLARRSQVLWTAFTLVMLLIVGAGFASQRLTSTLARDAETAAEQQHFIEEQATELEQQALVQEEQAAQLEEQATALRERVAEREDANRQLRDTTVFLDSALESAPIGIAFFDRSLRYHRVNSALATINGITAEEHLGRTLEEIVPDLAGKTRPVMERVLESGASVSGLILHGATSAHDRTRRRFSATFYPIARADEKPVGVGVMVVDTTEQHQLETQLRQSQKLEAVGRLAGGVAHDFNNVLTVIQSYAEVLAMELELDGRAVEEVTAIRAAADRAAALARQLLAFSRRDVIIPRDVDVAAVITGMDLILRRLLRQGVELRVLLADESFTVRMDAGQLEQVVMNLAINAVDAMPKGGTLTIRTLTDELPEGSAVAIEVEDTGSGMSAEVQERLFEPFFTTKPTGQGTGLGLATSYAIVREAGGVIKVDSKVGVGSRIRVLLPRMVAGSIADPARRLSPAYGLPAARDGERILLVEDEPSIRAALSRILRGAGYSVLEAGDGGEALRLAQNDSDLIHLLLTDVMMPGIGGKELVQRLRATHPDTRVIMMSGYTDDADLRESLGSAQFTFLQKPFAARAVLSAVRDALLPSA